MTLGAVDVEDDSLMYSVVSSPNHGVLTGEAPNLAYQPNTNYHGDDAFSFTVSDEVNISNFAEVSLVIESVNDIPIASAQSLEVLEDKVVPVKLSASDIEGDDLVYVIIDLPKQGLLTGDAPDLTYAPDVNFNGTDSFSFVVKDQDQISDLAVVDVMVIKVNDAPIIESKSVLILENTSTPITLVATDAENDPLTYTLISMPSNGTISNVDLPRLTYQPNANFNGIDHLTYVASDGELSSDIATVGITIMAVNAPPVAIGRSIATLEDTGIAIILTATGIEGGKLVYAIASNPSHGVLSGTIPNLIYLPNLNYYGEDKFTFTVSDGINVSQPANVNITVTSVNDLPQSDPKSLILAEDTKIPIVLSGIDVENQILTYEVTSVPSYGALSGQEPNLIYTPQPNFNGQDQFSYRSSDGLVSSNLSVVNITVTPTNDRPISMDVTKALVQKSQGNQIRLVADDVDEDSLTYQVLSLPDNGVLSPVEDGTVMYTPHPDFIGGDEFDFKVNDGQVDSETATVRLTVSNVLTTVIDLRKPDRPPVKLGVSGGEVLIAVPMIAERANVSVAVKIADLEELPSGFRKRARGAALKIDMKDEHGNRIESDFSEPMKIQIPIGTKMDSPNAIALSRDIENSTTELIPTQLVGTFPHQFLQGEISHLSYVFGVLNHTPIAADQQILLAEDSGPHQIVLDGSDDDGDALRFIAVSFPKKGDLLSVGHNWTYTPFKDANGQDQFTFVVDDGAAPSSVATVDILIQPLNDVPIAFSQQITLKPSTTIVLDGSDVDGDSLVYTIVSPPIGGSLSGVGQNLIYTSSEKFNQADQFSFQISDGQLESAMANVTIVSQNTTYATFHLSIEPGINLVHLPFRVLKMNDRHVFIRTIGDFYHLLGDDLVNLILTHQPARGWMSYLGDRGRGTDADREITPDLGFILIMNQSIDVKLEGIAYQSDGGDFIRLTKGINLVGLPVQVPYIRKVSDVLQLSGLKDGISSIIVLSSEGDFNVVSMPGDRGDVELIGGQALVMVARQDVIFKLSGGVRTDFVNSTN